MWGATSCPAPSRWQPANFNPRSPCGERPGRPARLRRSQRFQSTLPVWGATGGLPTAARRREFQSTLPVWGATNVQVSVLGPGLISIHAPRVGSDGILTGVDDGKGGFQSTLPVWGATGSRGKGDDLPKDFNPRSPCGERQLFCREYRGDLRFQSTLPVWGATGGLPTAARRREFQSTLPVWGATNVQVSVLGPGLISIHAPRVGSDGILTGVDDGKGGFQSTLPVWGATGSRGKGDDLPKDFNPRSPCGERQLFCREYRGDLRFQSTLPVWGATLVLELQERRGEISIHAPRVGSDSTISHMPQRKLISIHAPRVGSDRARF